MTLCSPRAEAHRDARVRGRSKGLRAGGFTLIEFLTTVAALVILMGLMISLARYVRSQSARQMTEEVLALLDEAMARYMGPSQVLPRGVPLLAAPDERLPEEAVLRARALQNNRWFVGILLKDLRLAAQGRSATTAPSATALSGFPGGLLELPRSLFDEKTLRDHWGSPIVFMPGVHPEIGMAPTTSDGRQTPFFFSAGPDGQYSTRADNIYSYER